MDAKPSMRREVALAEQAITADLNSRRTLLDLEFRCLNLEKDYNDLRRRLVRLLLPEQIEAARTCGITPEVYALEWIDIMKDTLRKFAPGSSPNLSSLLELKIGSY
jgi:hypothetical protein